MEQDSGYRHRQLQFGAQFLLVLCSHFILLARQHEFQDSFSRYDFRTSSVEIWIVGMVIVTLDLVFWTRSLSSKIVWIILVLFMSLCIAKCAVFTKWNDCTIAALVIQILVPNGALIYSVQHSFSSGTDSAYDALLSNAEESGGDATPKKQRKVDPRRLYSLGAI
jgi:hypothetical protein